MSEAIIAKKAELVDVVAEKMKAAASIVVVDARGLTVEQDTVLRRELRGSEVEYKVIKNSILRRAAEQAGLEDLASVFDGPTKTDARSSRPAFSAARRKIEFLMTLYSTSLPRSSRRRTVSCSTVKPRASTTTIDAAAFIFSATTSTSSAFLAIIASLISVFTSVIILLGEIFPKEKRAQT